jgi:hypothetical protein
VAKWGRLLAFDLLQQGTGIRRRLRASQTRNQQSGGSA